MSLPVDTLLADLQKSGAPESLLDNILNLIVDCDKRVEIARKLGRHMIVIDVSHFYYFNFRSFIFARNVGINLSCYCDRLSRKTIEQLYYNTWHS